jgi:hypothetical protein
MITIKLLGILDLSIAIIFWIFGIFHIFPTALITFLGTILIIKGIIFIIGFSFASVLDIICGIIIIIMIASGTIIMPKLIVIIIALYLLQKGVFSMFQ